MHKLKIKFEGFDMKGPTTPDGIFNAVEAKRLWGSAVNKSLAWLGPLIEKASKDHNRYIEVDIYKISEAQYEYLTSNLQFEVIRDPKQQRLIIRW